MRVRKVILSAAAGVLIAAASSFSGFAGGAASAVPAVPLEAEGAGPVGIVAGTGTRTPAFVTGLSAPAGQGSAVDAAREHLRGSRYGIADPDRSLALVRLEKGTGGDNTVRFAQRYKGLPVFGAQYLVHERGSGVARVVTGTNGKYFTNLSVDVTPRLSKSDAVLSALRSVADPRTRREIRGSVGELSVLPYGKGILAWHVTLRGIDYAAGRPPMRREVFVDAKNGRVVLGYSSLQFAEGPADATGPSTRPAETLPLEAFENATGKFELRDRTRPMWNGTTGEVLTYDANGRNYWEYLGELPADTPLVASESTDFSGRPSTSGGNDAHWGAGHVYDFYKKNFGRNGLDGKGASMISVVGTTYYGRPFINAFWDGTKMVYGWATGTYRPLSADLDVVGHEMTHGVITNSADLLYLGQSGAMNEALADYFGNAIDVTVTGTPMNSPDAGLLAEDICNKTPRECALRDLNDGRTTFDSYLGVTIGTDSGGVHLNSTIFSGALWDIREQLSPALVDKVVYKALTEYMTPLDTFTDGRNAVLASASASAMKLSKAQKTVIGKAFDAHGIVRGWERRLGTDSSTLVAGMTSATAQPDAALGRWVVENSSADQTAPTTVYTGSTVLPLPKRRLSPSDGRNHDDVGTDGRTAVWTGWEYDADGALQLDLLSRSLTGGPVSVVKHLTNAYVSSPTVSGKTMAWTEYGSNEGFPESDVWVRKPTGEMVNLTPDANVEGSWLSLRGETFGFVQISRNGSEWHYDPVIYNVRTGTKTVIPSAPNAFAPGIVVGNDYVAWLYDGTIDGKAAIKRANLDGTGVTDVIAETSADAPTFPVLTGVDDRLTFTSTNRTATGNAALSKLFQVSASGGKPQRLSCNRGAQLYPDADYGSRVVWVDGTAGSTDVVTRSRPAGGC